MPDVNHDTFLSLLATLPVHSIASVVTAAFERGDGVAFYENHDLSHPMLGDVKAVTFGSADAWMEADEPPMRMPDTPSGINWRYQLTGTYRGT